MTPVAVVLEKEEELQGAVAEYTRGADELEGGPIGQVSQVPIGRPTARVPRAQGQHRGPHLVQYVTPPLRGGEAGQALVEVHADDVTLRPRVDQYGRRGEVHAQADGVLVHAHHAGTSAVVGIAPETDREDGQPGGAVDEVQAPEVEGRLEAPPEVADEGRCVEGGLQGPYRGREDPVRHWCRKQRARHECHPKEMKNYRNGIVLALHMRFQRDSRLLWT
mmetsp:Transcript_6920/g.11890  ORF Transcript_6920/g.11890 Transcript_6920/m.11890 type:complete len:220 (+) Transcript_6920:662-1321(+)